MKRNLTSIYLITLAVLSVFANLTMDKPARAGDIMLGLFLATSALVYKEDRK